MESAPKLDNGILITGAAGYIGGAFALFLKSKGFQPICIDNFITCRYQHLIGLPFYNIDITEKEKLLYIMDKHHIKHVFHFAAFIEVPESVSEPLKYYRNNVYGSICLFECCAKMNVDNVVVSSTAAVYHGSDSELIEDTVKMPENPYGRSKLIVEEILQDVIASGAIKSGLCLRYFNVAGSWEGKYGANKAQQVHLIPIVLERIERGQCVYIFGDDYPTRDGTCVRDYIHITDLCEAHLQGIIWANEHGKGQCNSFNIGSGTGYTVKEVINTCQQIIGKFEWKISERRLGDPASLIAGVSKIKKIIGWEAKKGLKEIIEDAFEWGKKLHNWVKTEQTEFELEKILCMFNAAFDPFGTNQHPIRMFFAPGRINIIGEHTDYTKGYVLPAGITQGVYIVARCNCEKKIRLFGLSLGDISEERYQELDLNQKKFVKQNKWSDYVFACYFKLLEQHPEIKEQGIDALVFGDLEQNSGLSSSAAIEMCTLSTLLGLNDLPIPTPGSPEMAKLSLLAQSAENNYVGVMSGIMDQFASGNAQYNSAILLNCKNLETKYVKLELEGYKFVLVNTNKPRKLIESKYNERVQECQKGLELINVFRKQKGEKEIEYLGQMQLNDYTTELQEFIKSSNEIVYKRVSHVINENQRVIQLFNLLSKKNQITQIGELINNSGDSLKELFEVTGEHLDILVETAKKCKGVVGSRMVGAGFGGCTLNLIKNEKEIIQQFEKVVAEEYTKRTQIAPGFIEVEIGQGAREIKIKLK